ncbi:MAG: hypothetical protein IJT06_03090 [Selenomonadaceae bacterium]|nr:hypothetical protein [Selenomonadaceae bacterium]
MEVKRLNVPKGSSRVSFRNAPSEQSRSSRRTLRTRATTPQSSTQSSAYQINFAHRNFFIEEDFNDITIEELAKYMERDEDFVEAATVEEEKPKAAAQQPAQEFPVNQRKAAAADAYNWFATL